MSENYTIKSLDLYEIYQFDCGIFVVSRFVTKLQRFEKVRAINTFETASILSIILVDFCFQEDLDTGSQLLTLLSRETSAEEFL